MATTAERRARAEILATVPFAAVRAAEPALLTPLTRAMLEAPHRKAIRRLDQPLL